MRIKFTIFGKSIPKGRPRAAMRGGYPVMYTPGKTKQWEEYVKLAVTSYLPAELMKGALSIDITFYLVKPKSVSKKRKYPEVKPDWDNLGKAITDALEGLFYRNDSQIVDAGVHKRYGEPARVQVELSQIEEAEQ